eukprot:TRINITY_DN17918_c0_g1_i1.p1 TRINITY_DN17918_c0_g1~~TRINITY_DN17918_c0_g1_i1.p1  ORF type:complete len:297 (+),score=33.08 TRINITY_DN17918_c0_g1_i1:96-986(+)
MAASSSYSAETFRASQRITPHRLPRLGAEIRATETAQLKRGLNMIACLALGGKPTPPTVSEPPGADVPGDRVEEGWPLQSQSLRQQKIPRIVRSSDRLPRPAGKVVSSNLEVLARPAAAGAVVSSAAVQARPAAADSAVGSVVLRARPAAAVSAVGSVVPRARPAAADSPVSTASRPLRLGRPRDVAPPSQRVESSSCEVVPKLRVGKGGARRSQAVVRDSVVGMTKADLRRLARRAGCRRVAPTMLDEARKALRLFLSKVVGDVALYTEHAKRKVARPDDVVLSLRRHSRALYSR